jgi:hypothetical protein
VAPVPARREDTKHGLVLVVLHHECDVAQRGV